jgi:crossover junction endodeoxyribonuclease RuvC
VADTIERFAPQSVSIEGVFHCRNVRTAVTLGQSRGAAITACSVAGIPIFEYSPRRVKLAVCGSGAAQKEQVGRMIMKMLALEDLPPDDESDALALAVCHINSLTSVQALASKPL